MRNFLLSGVFSLTILGAFHSALAQAGHLDPSFGSGGIVQTNFGSGNTFSSSGAALAPNGDIVVSGTLTSGSGSFVAAVVHYLPSGALDSSFGSGGILTLPAPASVPGGESLGFGVAVQPDNKVLTIFEGFNSAGATATVLTRLNTNGTADSTFGTAGEVTVSLPTPANFGVSAGLVTLQPDGKILVAGFGESLLRRNAPPSVTILARYLTSGATDTSFGTNGVVEAVAVGNPSTVAFSGSNILVGNFLGQIAIFSPTGTLLQTSPSPSLVVDVGQPAAFLPNGDLLVGGTTEGPEGFKDNTDAEVLRYTISGLDTSFQSPLIRLGADAPFAGNAPTGIGFDSEGRIAVGVAFSHSHGTTGSNLFSVVRLNSNGSLDTTFGNGGIGATIPFTFGGNVIATLVAPNGNVIAAGNGTLVEYLAQ